MGAVSRLEDGGPSRPGTDDMLSASGIADILSALLVTGENLNAELPTQLVISQA